MDLNVIISILCLILAFLVIFFAVRANKAQKKNKELNKVRQNDIIETNKLLLEKSENDLTLLFQFENLLEELLKIMRKSDIHITKILDEQKDIRLILELTLKR